MDEEDNTQRSAAVPAAVAGASRPRFGEVNIRTRGRMPHWDKDGGLYFVTFHLADSLPQSVRDEIRRRRQLLEAARSGRTLLKAEQDTLKKTSTKAVEHLLDAGHGSCALRDTRVAEMVANALKFWDGKRYRLLSWCLMPNHVHVLFRLLPGERLAAIVGSWKSLTAKEANRILGRSGTFWQREYWDTLIRNEEHLHRAVLYIEANPERAGLANWPWVGRALP
jgi:REP element-mobilizing transposase RayT